MVVTETTEIGKCVVGGLGLVWLSVGLAEGAKAEIVILSGLGWLGLVWLAEAEIIILSWLGLVGLAKAKIIVLSRLGLVRLAEAEIIILSRLRWL